MSDGNEIPKATSQAQEQPPEDIQASRSPCSWEANFDGHVTQAKKTVDPEKCPKCDVVRGHKPDCSRRYMNCFSLLGRGKTEEKK